MFRKKEMVDINKNQKTDSKLGWFALGILTDYFIGKPIRTIRPIIYVGVGFTFGVIYNQHIFPKIVKLIQGIFF